MRNFLKSTATNREIPKEIEYFPQNRNGGPEKDLFRPSPTPHKLYYQNRI